jgi:hypothetical protein
MSTELERCSELRDIMDELVTDGVLMKKSVKERSTKQKIN